MTNDELAKPAGPILDELGVTLDVSDTQRVTEVLVIGKLTDLETGAVGLVIGSSDLDWIAARGLLSAAQQVHDQDDDLERVDGEGDDGG